MRRINLTTAPFLVPWQALEGRSKPQCIRTVKEDGAELVARAVPLHRFLPQGRAAFGRFPVATLLLNTTQGLDQGLRVCPKPWK